MSPATSSRFTLLGELGRGAMGLVYRAEDAQLEGEVALKTIRSQGPVTADQRLAFKEEFRAMARLAHPNLIQVHDYGQLDDETQFLTMEIVTGDDLDALMGQGPMPLETAYPLLIQLLQALAFIHSRRYVHRDIKPRNIRVTESGTLKLMDFGLMRQLGLAGGSTGLTGAPGYMSPEAIQGGVIGAYSDLYSVGCIAFEMVTGAPPFEGSMSEVLRCHLREAPPPMRIPGGRVPPRLQRIVAKLLEKDPESRYRDANEVIADLASLAGLDVARTNLDQKASYLTSDALVGREHELAALRRAFDQALAGEGASVFVGAPAGVGKSRLTQEFLLAAKLEEAIVLTGACQERGQAPYEPLARALKPLVAAFPPESQPVASLLAGEPVEKEALKDSLVSWLQAGAARRPIVLAIEDLHWCDPQSLEALNHIVRHASGHRLLVLATFRHDETPPGSPVWYTIEEEASTHLKLAAFDAHQVLALLRATLREVTITREFHQFLYDATAGNAFFLIELLRYLMEEGVLTQAGGSWHFPQEPGPVVLPRSLEATVTRRLAHLSPGAHRLASAAAVTGPRQDLPILLAVSGLDEEALFVHLDELVERQFICREPHGYAFPHSRVREALYEDLDAETRRTLHARCGLALEARGAGVDALAYHFRRGEDMPKAYAYMRKAAAQAERAGADAVALDYLGQAEAVLAGLDRPDKQAELAALWWEIGVSAFVLTPGPAIAAFEKLIPVLEAQGDPRLVDVLQMLSIAYALLGRPLKGLEVHDRALARMPERQTPAYAAVLTARCASQLTGGLYDELLSTAREAASILVEADLTDAPHPVRMARVGAVGIQNGVAFTGVKPDAALRDDALAAAAANGDDTPFTVLQYDGLWAAWTGRAEEATDYIEKTLAMGRRVGAPPFVWVLYLRPFLLHQRGEHADALAQIERALRYPHLEQADFTKQLLLVLKGQVHLALGQAALARGTIEDALARGREARMQLVVIQALVAMGQIEAAAGSWGEARARFRDAHALAAEGPARNPLMAAIASRHLGELATSEGLHIAARRHLGAAEATVTAPEQDNTIEQGHVQLAWGELHLARADRDEALAAFGRAERLYQRLKNSHWVHQAALRLEAARGLAAAPTRPWGTRELT